MGALALRAPLRRWWLVPATMVGLPVTMFLVALVVSGVFNALVVGWLCFSLFLLGLQHLAGLARRSRERWEAASPGAAVTGRVEPHVSDGS